MHRDDFPMIKDDLIYLDNGATTFKPKCVLEAMNDYYENYSANAHRGDYSISYKVDVAYENVGNALDKAIEIVKQGSVSDYVCEWKSDCHLENDNSAEWLISPHKPKKIFATDIKHCPYCGKKIKVVG